MPSSVIRSQVVETRHGVTVLDPYRWLEDRKSPATEDWIREQQKRLDDYFSNLRILQTIREHVGSYLNVESVDQPAKAGSRYFFRRRAKDREQGCLWVREIASGEERLLVDPSSDGIYASVGIYRISLDGAYLAYEFKRGGEDRKEIRFVDVDRGLILPECLPLGYGYGLAFVGKGYFYSHDAQGDSSAHSIRYHLLGSKDPDPIVFVARRFSDSKLILTADEGRLGAFWERSLGPDRVADFWVANMTETPAWAEVFHEKHLPYNPVLCGGRIFVSAETVSKNSRLIELSSSGEELRSVIPESKYPIRQFVISPNRVLVSYLKPDGMAIDAWSSDGQMLDPVRPPLQQTIQILPSYGGCADNIFYCVESFNAPPAVYEHAAKANSSHLWYQSGAPKEIRHYVIDEVTAPSTDGTEIPITLVSISESNAGRPVPVIMTSYGGFGLAMTPRFSVLVSLMMELGVTFALPHIRGGGEFGRAWHDAGRARNRQVAFDDFVGAAEWLIGNQITTPEQLGIFGGSNSGLLVGAVMTQRPDLFGAVLCIAPLLDMLRYEHFDRAVKWRHEYGTVEDEEDFKALLAYSPYHHIEENVNYPATMFVSGDKDDRCNPAHVRKMAAMLQRRLAQASPVIVDYSEERGHSPLLPLSVRIAALTRRVAFLCQELKIALPNGDLL